MRTLVLTMRIPAIAFIALVMASPAGPPAEVALSTAAAAPGETAALSLTFSAGAEMASGIQFDLQYDGSLMGLQVTAGEAARAAGKSLYMADLDSNTKRLLFAGGNAALLQEGSLAEISATVAPGTAPGTYPLTIANVIATTPDGEQAFAGAVAGSLTVPAAGEARTRVLFRTDTIGRGSAARPSR